MRSKWGGKVLCGFVGGCPLIMGAVLALVVSTSVLASPDDEFVTQEDLKALKEEVKTLKDELQSIKAVKSEEAPAITGNVYSELSRKIKLGGEIRTRFESFYNFDFTGSPTDNFDDKKGGHTEATLLRTRLNLDADVNDYLRAFIELQDNRAFGEEGNASANPTGNKLIGAGKGTIGNLDRVDLLQGFIELKSFSPVSSTLANLSTLIGRWRLNYGSERIIGPLDWTNQGRSWDGARLRWASKDSGWIDGFITQLDEDFTDRDAKDIDEVFWGIYGHCTALKDFGIGEIEPYFLGRNQSESGGRLFFGFPSTSIDREDRYTAGIRLAGEPSQLPGLDYEIEGDYQFGHVEVSGSEFDIDQAYSIYAGAGYTLKNTAWTPRFGGAFNLATGTSASEEVDGEFNTFDQMYPTGHKFLGYIDLVGRQNIIDYEVNLSAKPTKKWLLKTDFHFFYLEEPADAWYNAAGNAIARWNGTGSEPDDELGREVDLLARYALFKNFTVELGYVHFFAGDFIQDENVETTAGKTFGNSDADWFYLMTTLKF